MHKALKRALGLDEPAGRVVQAETGGGFGGKEEYPSMIAVHAALLARAAGRPVRMIYDRHEDIAATTKRHPAIVRHRTGVTRDGELVAQDIEIVMDGGAYCTLTPVVLSRGTLHAGGPYRCPNVRIRARAVATNTPPNGAFRGFGAPQTEFAAEMQVEPRRRGARACRRSSCAGAGSTGSATRRPTGQVLRASVAGEEVLERAAEAAEFERVRERTAARPGRAGRRRLIARRRSTPRDGRAPRASGWRWPGTAPASPAVGRGPPRLASPAVELDRGRPDRAS